jgi:hypothetical protein
MPNDKNIPRELLIEQVLFATTLDEIRAARAALRAWITSHPDDRLPLSDGFAMLANLEEAVSEADQSVVA